MKHSIQSTEIDKRGVLRFKRNEIVCFLLEHGRTSGIDMNTIACKEFSQEDREQFAQLIGYSLSGFSDLSYATNETVCAAREMNKGFSEKDSRLTYQDELIKGVKEKVRDLAVDVFNIHPDNLK
jgi:hypothetical protein